MSLQNGNEKKSILFQARAYAEDPNHKFDMKLEAMVPVIPLEYLPVCAGLAIAKGMPYERAMEAVTINPARVMGVEDRVGNLAPGKDADLVIWKDKPFVVIQDPVAVFIDGKRV